jgi:hypothetical protein
MNDGFIALVVGIGLLGTIYAIGKWILGPIDRAARQRRAPIRFAISDFLCLFIAVQLPLALVSRLQSEDTKAYFWTFSILAWVVAPVIWICCAIALSRAGITSGKHRIVFMGLVLPIVYYGLIPFVVMAAFVVASLLAGQVDEILRRWWLAIVWVLTGAALVGCGLFTNRMVASRPTIQQDSASRPLDTSSRT